MSDEKKESIYVKSKTHPGLYEYRPEIADEIRKRDAHLWNVEAVRKLDEMYDRLGVPQGLRR